ncbi:MAG: hypothetical protein K8R25_11740 [Methanosarcinales archaeon]|nr:hypothetical protein [Methanosarcinales archaeon]
MDKELKIGIITGLFGVLVALIYIFPQIYSPANIEIVDVTCYENILDIKARNVGKKIGVINKVDIEIINASVDYTPDLFILRSIGEDSMEVNITNIGWGPALNVTFTDLINANELIDILAINNSNLLWQGNITEGERIRIVYQFKHTMKITHNVSDIQNPIYNGELYSLTTYWDIYGHNHSKEDNSDYYIFTNDSIYLKPIKAGEGGGLGLGISEFYPITLDPEKKMPHQKSVNVSQQLQPNTADRFTIEIYSEKTANYIIKVYIYYNENEKFESNIIEVKSPKKDNN